MSTPRFAVDRIHRIAVIGAGTMGHGIAHVAALAGHDVRLYDVTAEAAAAGRAKVVANLGKGVELGKLAGELRDAALARLTATGDLAAACAEVDLVIEAVPDIPGAPAGIYWDGGLIDYHLHLPWPRFDGLVLYPHFTDRIVPGWLDKALPWRKARAEWLDNVVLVSPSREYLARLPHGKLPDRSDFKRYGDDFDGRHA